MKKTICLLCALMLLGVMEMDAKRKKKEKRSIVRIETTAGTMRVALSDDTPLHRDNFLTLVADSFYNGLLFHRVMENFIIQAGDPDSRDAKPGDKLGEGGTGYIIPPEFDLPYLYHWRGALAAARRPDELNPYQYSNGSQFYIVWGYRHKTSQIDKARALLNGLNIELTYQMALDYEMRGGTPTLDGQYTVFGEVIEGLEIVEKIQAVPTDDNDRPLQDIAIIRMSVEQLSEKVTSKK